MSAIRVWLSCVVLAACARASAAPLKVEPLAWSPSVDGVRGRLIATPAADTKGNPQLRVELELENTSDVGTPIAISWGALGSMLKLSVVGGDGKPIADAGIGGNELAPAPVALQLPHASTLRVTISPAAYEYVPTGRTLFRPLALQAWDVAPGAHLYLRGTLAPYPGDEAHAGPRAWKGPLELPVIALP